MPLFRRADQIYERLADDRNRQIILSNLGDALFEIGAFREAEGVLRQALVLNRKLEDKFQEAVTLQYLGRVLAARGEVSLVHRVGRGRRLFAGPAIARAKASSPPISPNTRSGAANSPRPPPSPTGHGN